MTARRHFASDNNAGIHPAVWQAMRDADRGHAPSYGHDLLTARMEQAFRDHFGEQAQVWPVFTGTAANVLGLEWLTRPHQAVIARCLGLKPDLVIGSSVGSLVGAFYAAGLPVERIERFGKRMKPNTLRDWVFPKLGVFGGAGIRRFVVQRIGQRTIESLPMRFAAVATDLRTGESLILDRGDLGRAVQASSSAPGLLEPVRIGSQLLVEGNLSAAVPVDAAKQLGARHVIAVDVTFPPEQADLSDPYDALYQGFSILTRKLAVAERERADVVIAPDLPRHDSMSRSIIEAMMDAGESAANAALPRLQPLFAKA